MVAGLFALFVACIYMADSTECYLCNYYNYSIDSTMSWFLSWMKYNNGVNQCPSCTPNSDHCEFQFNNRSLQTVSNK